MYYLEVRHPIFTPSLQRKYFEENQAHAIIALIIPKAHLKKVHYAYIVGTFRIRFVPSFLGMGISRNP